MDLSSLRVSSDAVEMPLVHPSTGLPLENKDGEEMALLVIGTDHDDYQKLNNELLNKRLKKSAQSRKVSITAEEVNAESLQRTVACIVGFKNLQVDGEPLEFSKKNAEALLKEYPAIREQVEEFVAERANFLN